jgi:hypothetical protein
MKQFTVLLCVFILYVISPVFAQKVSETNFGIGFSKTPSNEEIKQHWWDDSPPPTFLNINTSKSWYRNDRKITLQKEIGLNLQYANIGVGGGGLGAGNYYSGKIINLNAEASLQIRVYIDCMISFGIGPTSEYLLLGYNNINNSYYTHSDPPRSGDIRTSGINRDYYNQPSYGIKMSIINSRIKGENILGLDVSYLWTKSEHSNFYASNYFQVSFFIGFRKQNKEVILDPLN